MRFMRGLSPEILAIIESFAPLFTVSVWRHARVLLLGAILAPGARTVASVLRVMGRASQRRYKNYHRVLSRARWSGLAGSRMLLRMLVAAFVLTGPVIIGVDDTIERRWGAKIRARGIYRDPVRSSRGHFVKASAAKSPPPVCPQGKKALGRGVARGLRWLSVMVLAEVPWAARVWALPFLTPLCPSQRYYEGYGRAHRPLTERARQALRLLKRWLPGRQIVAVADSGFAALELLAAVTGGGLSVVTRLRLDAALYDPAPPRRPGQRGRPRRKGRRLATLEQVATDSETVWQTLQVQRWYGQMDRRIEIASDTALWSHSGKPAVPIRWVLIRDPEGHFPTQALLSTDPNAAPEDIVRWFVRRWQVEVTFAEVRARLGVETQRQWSDKAIARTTPVLMALFSLVTLMADQLIASGPMPVRTSTWYRKASPTFSDALALVRRRLWAGGVFSTSPHGGDNAKSQQALIEHLTEVICYAA